MCNCCTSESEPFPPQNRFLYKLFLCEVTQRLGDSVKIAMGYQTRSTVSAIKTELLSVVLPHVIAREELP